MKEYKKIIDGKTIIKSANKIVIRKDGMQTINPSEEQILADGWAEYIKPEYMPILDDVKEFKIKEILAYDNSSAVNQFTIGGIPMWLDKATRAGLLLRFEAESKVGREETTLWNEGVSYTLPLADAMQMLIALELYASECYDNTQRHLAEVSKLETIAEVEAYDYTIGYPAKLAL